MIEQQVETEVLAANRQLILFADEREVSPQLQEESLQVHDDRRLQFLLGMRFRQTQKVHEVTVLEDGFGIRVQLCHRW